MGRYLFFKLVTLLAVILPECLLYWVARVLARADYYTSKSRRDAVMSNMDILLGPDTPRSRKKRYTKLIFRNFGYYLAEFFGYQRFGAKFIKKYVDVTGVEHFRNAMEQGKGALLVTSHMSNWEMGAAVLALEGYKLTGIAMKHPHEKLDRLFNVQRESRGYDVIASEGAYKKSMKLLANNEVVCFAGDRDVGIGQAEVDFCGHKAIFSVGPARMAIASGAAFIPGCVIRTPDGYGAIIEEPIAVPENGSRKEKAKIMTQEFAHRVEKWVKMFPTQWGVFHHYWVENQPKDEVAS